MSTVIPFESQYTSHSKGGAIEVKWIPQNHKRGGPWRVLTHYFFKSLDTLGFVIFKLIWSQRLSDVLVLHFVTGFRKDGRGPHEEFICKNSYM
jgi:hypothetical protein